MMQVRGWAALLLAGIISTVAFVLVLYGLLIFMESI